MDDMLSELGDLFVSMVIGYLGAVEFLYVVRHLYHWSFRHPAVTDNDADGLQRLQQNMRNQLAEAEEREALAGNNAMQDGVLYKDGFRIDAPQTTEAKEKRHKEIESELARQKHIEEETRKQLEKAEAELEWQRKQAAEEAKKAEELTKNTRKLLETERLREAEQRRLEVEQQEAEENERQLLENERKLVDEQRRREEEAEAAENSRKLVEAERQREDEQRRIEAAEQEAEENKQKLIEAEVQREKEQRIREAAKQEAEENEQKLIKSEQQREEEQSRVEDEEEIDENVRKLIEAEIQREEELLRREQEAAENERTLIEAERQREADQRQLETDEQYDNEMSHRLEEAEREFSKLVNAHDDDDEEVETVERIIIETERERERKQQLIEKNARQFLEAEQEMVELQQQMVEAEMERLVASGLEMQPQTPVVEEPCIKKIISNKFTAGAVPIEVENERPMHTVKTQFGQSSQNEPYLQPSKSLLFPGISDDGSSVEPDSSKQSSFSTQPSEEVTTTGAEDVSNIAMQFPQVERQEPDGEDNLPSIQYTDEYLRSLDGIKHPRPLVREDGSGRRRAFKKRRSSGSSTSSRESRHSREEELKMFTSLEEEEMQSAQRVGEEDFTPIKYSSEPTLKVKAHHRRHKRSPAKDAIAAAGEESQRGSLEMLGEEGDTNPWGELPPEHYKHTEFWKREKAMSIDEEEVEVEKTNLKEEGKTDVAVNIPKTSSFEDATPTQSEEALSAFQHQQSMEAVDNAQVTATTKVDNARSDTKINLQTSQNTEGDASPARSSASPRLRRSPRIDEIVNYEERWKETAESAGSSAQPSLATPTISIQESSNNEPWRDEYGLIMQGLSDFYDFQASVNPSRSRSTSRNPSPPNSPPSSPHPKNVSYMRENEERTETMETNTSSALVDVYDDTGNLSGCELRNENITEIIESLTNESKSLNSQSTVLAVEHVSEEKENFELEQTQQLFDKLKNVSDDRNMPAFSDGVKVDTVPTICIANTEKLSDSNEIDTRENMNALVQSLRAERGRSRSRSRSPLPTTDNIEHSLETRQQKLIKHDDELLEKLSMSPEVPNIEVLAIAESCEAESAYADPEDCSKENMSLLVESLRSNRSRSRSRSPLPTADNIQRSLDSRRNKLIQHNDELYEKLSERTPSPISGITAEIKANIFDAPSISISASSELCEVERVNREDDDCSKENISHLVESLRSNRSRSRSRSPLPSADNIQRSLDNRRNKLIQCNDEIFEKLAERTPSPVEEPTTTAIKNNILDAPSISIECAEEDSASLSEDIECSQANMSSLVGSLRVARSKSRSKSPMRLPTTENVERSMALRRNKLIERNDEVLEQIIERAKTPDPPRLAVEYIYEIIEASEEQSFAECKPQENITIESRPRSRNSRSRTPSRSQSPIKNVSPSPERYSFVERLKTEPNFEDTNSPTYQIMENPNEYYDFNMMLNLEASQNRTLSKNSEELESILAEKQRVLDEEALHKLKTAVEEMELRTLTPSEIEHCDDKNSSGGDENDYVGELTINERMHQLRCSPTTPDYDRSISEEWRDVQRIKKDMLTSGFKRSTYVGESTDLGSEYENLRREAAQFRRSQSPSPSCSRTDLETARRIALERRKVQDEILAELTSAKDSDANENRFGAKPKTERKLSNDYDRSVSKEALDTQRIKDEQLSSGFKRSTYVGESVDLAVQLEDRRREMAEFRRSNSRSRSPLDAKESKDVANIETEAAKRELKDKILDEIEKTTVNFQDFSRHLNPDFLDNERRASDSALIQKPEILIQFQDSDSDLYMEPEEYHHFRRYSLCQEQPVEEYPNDDYVYVSQIEVRTLTGTRTWIREDYYSEDFDNLNFEISDSEATKETSAEVLSVHEEQPVRDDEDTDGSEDERQTVVDVEDEIDTDICDFNERGPADESHHEQSECEEAEREMDRYAGRGANDWDEAEGTNKFIAYDETENIVAEATHQGEEEGAVGGNSGGSAYDSDSFTIDQIYNDAIRSRKQSGILRDYDCILQDMQNNFMSNEGDASMISDSDRYAAWAKARNLDKPKFQRSNSGVESSSGFLDSERRDHEMRYLGDAKGTARQSARLHSRYGYVPLLQSNAVVVEDDNVDLNYKPKREYNWRKNFKLDDDQQPMNDESLRKDFEEYFLNESEDFASPQYLDMRKYSLGGESITLFSRSPERDGLEQVLEEDVHDNEDAVVYAEPEATVSNHFTEEIPNETEAPPIEKPKKKKSKKKTRKESKASLENHLKNTEEDEDSESQIYSRRSSSLQMETDSPKRKSHSRRSSKSSLTNESPLFSPRSSVGLAEANSDITEEYAESKVAAAPSKKKTKKRKKAKESFAQEAEIQEEQPAEVIVEQETTKLAPVSSTMTPESSMLNLLATLSPQNSVCVTPASTESETGERPAMETKTSDTTVTLTTPTITPTISQTTTSENTSTTTTTSAPVDSFDILKDANFYPLF